MRYKVETKSWIPENTDNKNTCNTKSLAALASIMTRLGTGWCIIQIPAGTRYFSLLQNVQNMSGAHTASYSMDTGVLLQG